MLRTMHSAQRRAWRRRYRGQLLWGVGALLLLVACGTPGAAPPATQPPVRPNSGAPDAGPAEVGAPPTSGALPDAFNHFAPQVEITVEGDMVVLKTSAIPNHPSPYFERSDPRYEPYTGDNPLFRQNPFIIREHALVFRIPLSPQPARRHRATPLGPIGIAVDGVALFNQYNGVRRPLTDEINMFDQYNGHPQPEGMYHYHTEPLAITQAAGKDALIGFLLDGYPVYGPEENGRAIENADLDEFHGHAHPTADYPAGVYHYHVTAAPPYINGEGFYGTPGTLTLSR